MARLCGPARCEKNQSFTCSTFGFIFFHRHSKTNIRKNKSDARRGHPSYCGTSSYSQAAALLLLAALKVLVKNK